jgi:hypothetical protein
MMFLKRTRSVSEPREEISASPCIDLPVVADWDDLVRRADALADVIDSHLAYESALQGRTLSVGTLCPAQKASLAGDIAHVVRGDG